MQAKSVMGHQFGCCNLPVQSEVIREKLPLPSIVGFQSSFVFAIIHSTCVTIPWSVNFDFFILSLSFCPVYWQLLREEDLISKHSEQQQQKRVLIFSKWFWDFQIIWLCHSNGVLYFPNDFWDFQISGCVTTIEFYISQMILGFSDYLVVSQQ